MRDMAEPKGGEYWYIGEDEKWYIQEDAPDWAKEEFDTYFNVDNSKDDVIEIR
ncbi:MAG: hypothetical protein R3Y47_02105 [Lachnospiraceae bacterium]